MYEIRSATLNSAGIGGEGFRGGSCSSGPSSLPPTLNNYNKNSKEYGVINLENPLSRSISTEDNHHLFSSLGSRGGLPPKGSSLFSGGTVGNKSPYTPKKSLLTVTKSDPGNREEGNINSGIFSERLAQFQRRSSGSGLHEVSPVANNLEKDKQCGDRISVQNTPNNVMHQVKYIYIFSLDSIYFRVTLMNWDMLIKNNSFNNSLSHETFLIR